MSNKSIRKQRFEKVADVVSCNNVKSILEIGCGDGKFLPYIEKIKKISCVVVIDKDEKKINRIKKTYTNVESHCGSFMKFYDNLKHCDSIVAIEVIEHLESKELENFIEIIFSKLKPKLVVFTTPNIEYNTNYPVLYNGFRHITHVFEFSPRQLKDWGNKIISNFNDYEFFVDFCDSVGSSQIIVFNRRCS